MRGRVVWLLGKSVRNGLTIREGSAARSSAPWGRSRGLHLFRDSVLGLGNCVSNRTLDFKAAALLSAVELESPAKWVRR